jgi:hypothetical protein
MYSRLPSVCRCAARGGRTRLLTLPIAPTRAGTRTRHHLTHQPASARAPQHRSAQQSGWVFGIPTVSPTYACHATASSERAGGSERQRASGERAGGERAGGERAAASRRQRAAASGRRASGSGERAASGGERQRAASETSERAVSRRRATSERAGGERAQSLRSSTERATTLEDPKISKSKRNHPEITACNAIDLPNANRNFRMYKCYLYAYLLIYHLAL